MEGEREEEGEWSGWRRYLTYFNAGGFCGTCLVISLYPNDFIIVIVNNNNVI